MTTPRQPARPTSEATFEPPDLTGFLTGHSLMRTQFALLARAAGEVSRTDARRLAALDAHLAFMTRRLVQHHTAEDERIWPQLRGLDPALQDLLDDLEQDHERLERTLGIAGSTATSLPKRAPALRDLHRDLAAHLDREEELAVPAIRRLIPQSAWALEHQRFTEELGADRTTTLVWILGHLPPAARAGFLSELPAPVRLLYRTVWRPRHRRTVALMYGPEGTRTS
jgi:iron-sulfur cluster repair protein YtfE (RIC family)